MTWCVAPVFPRVLSFPCICFPTWGASRFIHAHHICRIIWCPPRTCRANITLCASASWCVNPFIHYGLTITF
ncbi:hypothetical protein BJ912DRAFT_971777 [Pholiota molesta]|nr:hypothetical protein BJ912DRAFT_971777 [Pholiota molesta]